MSSGPSRELLELWAPDAKNGVIITGYSVEGTMARVSVVLFYFATFLFQIFARGQRAIPRRLDPSCMNPMMQCNFFLTPRSTPHTVTPLSLHKSVVHAESALVIPSRSFPTLEHVPAFVFP